MCTNDTTRNQLLKIVEEETCENELYQMLKLKKDIRRWHNCIRKELIDIVILKLLGTEID